MLSSSKSGLVTCLLLLLLVFTTSQAEGNEVDIHRRQAIIESDGETINDCIPSCELGSCGPQACGIRKRTPSGAYFQASDVVAVNATYDHLKKRQWRITTTNGNLQDQAPPWQIDQVNTYVHTQVLNPSFDNQYGGLLGFYYTDPTTQRGDERAVSQRAAFGKTAFQFGSNGLHGCQMVTVISKRAVWMAHFWESYTNGKPNSDTLNERRGFAAFRERMLYFLSGISVNPTTANKGYYPVGYPKLNPTKNHPYISPFGDPLDNADFNQPGDNTKVFIMTPLTGTGTKKDPIILKYKERLDYVESTLRDYLGPDITIIQYPYSPINTDIEEQDTDQRGLALFQYDPNADGKGLKQWRLFYENSYYYDNI